MLKHQLATAVENEYGTVVSPDRGYEFLPGETIGRDNVVINSSGLKPGTRGTRGSSRVLTGRSGAGTLPFEVATTGFGRWFEHMLGADPVITQQEDTAAYLHTYSPGDLWGKSLTIQKGVEPVGGAAVPFTYLGCKIPGWEMSISRNGLLLLNVDIDSQDEITGEALYAGSFPNPKLFHFMQATLSIDGSPVANVSEWSGRGTNPMNTDRYFFGGSGTKSEPYENDRRRVDGNMSADFIDLATFHTAFAADTSLELELSFQGDLIEAGASVDYFEELTILLDDIRLTGETPKVTGPEPAVQNIPFEAFETDAGEMITITYQTTDAAA